MKNLIIVRHAKSSWENYSSDKARILTEKGSLAGAETLACKWQPEC